MMSISNFADWFVPTTTTANEAAAEPETTDQAPQDFATLLAASYTAPLVVTPPTVVPSTVADRVTQPMEASPVTATFTLPAELRSPLLASEVAPLPTVTTPVVPLTSSPEWTSAGSRTDVSPFAVSSQSEPTSRTEVSPFMTNKDDNRMKPASPLVNSTRREFVAPATTSEARDKSDISTATRYSQVAVAATSAVPYQEFARSITTPALPALAKSETLSANIMPTLEVEQRHDSPSLTPSVETSVARKEALPPLTPPQDAVTVSLPHDGKQPEAAAPLVMQDFSVSPFSVEADTKIKAGNLTAMPSSATPPSVTDSPLPEPLATASLTEMTTDFRRAVVVSPPPLSTGQPALPAMLGGSHPIVTEMVRLAAAVVKTIAAEQARHNESLATVATTVTTTAATTEATNVAIKDLPPAPQMAAVPVSAASDAVMREPFGTTQISTSITDVVPRPVVRQQPSVFTPVNDFTVEVTSQTLPVDELSLRPAKKLPIEFAPQPLPTSLRTPQPGVVSQEPTPLPIVGQVKTATRAPIASDAIEPLPRGFDVSPRVVANRAEVALPSPSVPLEAGREVVQVEDFEAMITAPTTPATPSGKVPPPAGNLAPTTPAPPIAQTIPPVLALAQAVHPNETQTLRFSLNPAELGRVEVEVTRDVDGRVSASLTVEQADTAQALTHGIGQLRETLERAGLVVEQLQVTTQLQSQTAQQFGQQTGQQTGQQQASQSYDPNADSSSTDPMIADGTTSNSEDKLLSLHV